MKTETNGQIVRKPRDPADRMISLIELMKTQITEALPAHLSPTRMARIASTALRTTPALADCTPISFLGAIMSCSVLGLEPNTPLGQAYLIPFKNRKNQCTDCQLIIGYQGMMALIRRSDMVAGIQAFAVFQGDEFRYSFGLQPTLHHVPGDGPENGDPSKLTHAYAVVRLKDAGADPIFVVLTRRQIEAARVRGASGRGVSTPWDTDYVAMALKTAMRAAFKWAPRSAEMARADAIDTTGEGGGSLVPFLPDEANRMLLASGVAEPEPPSAPAAEEPDPPVGTRNPDDPDSY